MFMAAWKSVFVAFVYRVCLSLLFLSRLFLLINAFLFNPPFLSPLLSWCLHSFTHSPVHTLTQLQLSLSFIFFIILSVPSFPLISFTHIFAYFNWRFPPMLLSGYRQSIFASLHPFPFISVCQPKASVFDSIIKMYLFQYEKEANERNTFKQ